MRRRFKYLPGNIGTTGIAAIAAGKLLYPSRTQKISPPAFLIVLRCASPREVRIAAIPPINLFTGCCSISPTSLSRVGEEDKR